MCFAGACVRVRVGPGTKHGEHHADPHNNTGATMQAPRPSGPPPATATGTDNSQFVRQQLVQASALQAVAAAQAKVAEADILNNLPDVRVLTAAL